MHELQLISLRNPDITAAHMIIGLYTLYTLYHAKVAQRGKLIALVSSFLVLGSINWVCYAQLILRSTRVIFDMLGDQLKGNPQNLEAWMWQGSRTLLFLVKIPAVIILVLAEGYLVYRCCTIWNRHRLIVIPLVSMYLFIVTTGNMAEAVIWAVEFPGFPSTQPHDRVESTKANAALFWIALVAFNLIVTILIVARLLILRARMIGTLGKQYGSGYTGIVAIVVESALIYDLWLTLSFMFFPGTPYIGSVFNPGITQSLCISMELIILRLSMGQGISAAVATAARHSPPLPVSNKTALEDANPIQSLRAERGNQETSTRASQFPSSVAAVIRSFDSRFSVQEVHRPGPVA